MLSSGPDPDPGQRKAALLMAAAGLCFTLTAVWLVISRLPANPLVLHSTSAGPDSVHQAGWYLAMTVSLLTVVLLCAVLFFWRWGKKLKEQPAAKITDPAAASPDRLRQESTGHDPGDPT